MKKINIKGVIVSSDLGWIYEIFDIDHVTPKYVDKAIEEADGDDLEVHINSPGGIVDVGSEIYTTLKDYAGHVTVKIVGAAASAASVVAMSGDRVLMSPTGQIMIHDAMFGVRGNKHDMKRGFAMLSAVDKSIANAYRLKTNLSEEKLLSLMDKETWFTAQDAKEKGFVDEIMFDDDQRLVASYGISKLLPQEVIDKVRNMKDRFKPQKLEDGGELPSGEPEDNENLLAKQRQRILDLKFKELI